MFKHVLHYFCIEAMILYITVKYLLSSLCTIYCACTAYLSIYYKDQSSTVTKQHFRVKCWIKKIYLSRKVPNLPKKRQHTIITVIIWLAPRAGKMTQIACCDWLPERARWSSLARSGLPAISRKKNFPESHIINPLLTKFVRSRGLDISQVIF